MLLSEHFTDSVYEFQAKKAAKLALVQHGLSKGDTRSVTFKLPSTDELSLKRVDPSQLAVSSRSPHTKSHTFYLYKLFFPPTARAKAHTLDLYKLFMQAHVKRKMTKEERLEMVKAGREDRGKYQARAAIKQKKVTREPYSLVLPRATTCSRLVKM